MIARLIACTVLAVLAVAGSAGAGEDPRAIRLLDQNGASVALNDLRGRPVALTFVATRCTDACPIATGTFALVAGRLARDRVRATLVTVTLDPAYDTPFAMAAYARRFGADARVWRFLSGPPGDVRRLAHALGVTARAGPDGVPDVHSTFVYVLDGHARLARTLLLSSNGTDEIANALRDLAASRR